MSREAYMLNCNEARNLLLNSHFVAFEASNRSIPVITCVNSSLETGLSALQCLSKQVLDLNSKANAENLESMFNAC